MRDNLYIKSRLAEVDTETVPQNPDSLTIHNAKQSVLYWIYNSGNVRTEKELLLQLQNFKEELLGLEFANSNEFSKKVVDVKIKEVENILEN